ncbi:MAG: hypothetical protein IPK85_03450 [Gemmatimonadetes bacterium]|nr:hypothetical protein [Gemmatimonadota bacterium]
MNVIYLTEKHLESLMTGEIVSIEGPLNFSTKIVPPDNVRDTCHVSWSLHNAIVRRLEAEVGRMKDAAEVAFDTADKLRDDNANLQKAYDDIRVKYMRLTT